MNHSNDKPESFGSFKLMYRVYKYILPEVRSQLARWREAAEQIPDRELQKQAVASMTSKQFHCEGGAVYAAMNLRQRHVLIPLIVAFQTISDYLDNLCDRSTSLDPRDFRQLHQSMLDAVNPSATLRDYYSFHPEREDGGYLDQLVRTCQTCLCMLPAYETVQRHVIKLVSLYCDLQVYKHIRPDLREPSLLEWWEPYRGEYGDLQWNEFAAACGSTLGVFMLFLAATDKNTNEESAKRIFDSYFPYVCSLHILLDYLIDQEEDLQGGDLNFCSYYEHSEMMVERFEYVVRQARQEIRRLRHARFHRMIIEGLIGLYLSDPKVKHQRQVGYVTRRLMRRSPLTRLFFWANSIWIRKTLY